jgi:hypothetical protein
MSFLNNIIVDYEDYSQSFAVLPTILTKSIYAVTDTSVEGEATDVDLQVGASGNIQFLVSGGFNAGVTNNMEFSSLDNVFKMTANNNQILGLFAGDIDKTILLGDLRVTSTLGRQSIYASNATELFVSSDTEIILNSKVNVVNDLKIGGNIFSKELNITHTAGSGTDYGYAFRVDNVTLALELVKYSSDNTTDTCQLVATFGQGNYTNDTTRDFNEYGSSGGSVGGTGVTGGTGGTGGGLISLPGWVTYEQSNVLLSAFSNDLIFNNLEVDLGDLDITTDTITSSSGSVNVETVTFTDAAVTNVNKVTFDGATAEIDMAGGVIENVSELNMAGGSATIKNETGTVTVEQSVFSGSNINTTQVNLDSIGFEDIGANRHIWNGHASNIFGIADYIAVTESFSENITHNSHLIPTLSNEYDLGSKEYPWRDLYVGQNTIHIGTNLTIGEDVSGAMTVAGGALKPENIEFEDGSTIGSMTDVLITVQNDTSEKFGDFDTISYTTYMNSELRMVQNFEGSYVYGKNSYDVAMSGGNWSVYNCLTDVIPIKEDGSGIDLSDIAYFSGKKPTKVKINSLYVYQKTRTRLGDNLLFSSTGNFNINETFLLRTLDPFSQAFKNKAKIDFHKFQNLDKLELGQMVNNQQIYSTRESTNEYIAFNHIDTKQTSKIFAIEFITLFRAPKYDDIFLDSSIHKYLVPGSKLDRLTKIYELTVDLDVHTGTSSHAYVLKDLNPIYGLYPRLQLQKWDNSVNNTNFSDIIVDSNIQGWGSIDQVWTTFMNNGWLFMLYKLTYMYIVYGDVDFGDENGIYKLHTKDSALEKKLAELSSSSITFVNDDDNDDNEIVYNNVICFKKTAFDHITSFTGLV